MENRRYPLVYPPTLPQSTKPKRRARPWKPKGVFRFFDLPAELRERILEDALTVPHTIDLHVSNIRCIAPLLDLFLVCRRMHQEAYPVFYGRNVFRLFPAPGKFFYTDEVLLERLPERYRACVNSIELRLGPGWCDVPEAWFIGKFWHRRTEGPKWRRHLARAKSGNGLTDCVSLRMLKIVVECDPSHPVFEGFRISEEFYTTFSGDLLQSIFRLAPSIRTVELDGYQSVDLQGPLMRELLKQTLIEQKRITFGPDRGWVKESIRRTELVT